MRRFPFHHESLEVLLLGNLAFHVTFIVVAIFFFVDGR